MNQARANDPQESAREFNEEETVLQRCNQTRWRRRSLGLMFLFAEKLLENLDWLEAEREVRGTKAVGNWIDP